MRSMLARRRTVRMAAMAACVALLAAACSKPGPDTDAGPGGGGVLGDVTLGPDTLLVSNGTAQVSIGDATVTFGSTVTDAAWSPDGTRIAYVDGDGNIATARPDGSGVVVLTKSSAAVTRSRPSWSRQWIFYAERKADGTSTLMSVEANGCAVVNHPAGGAEWEMDTGDGTSYIDSAPSGSLSVRPSRVAFQHDEPSGPEIWVNDTNQRAPETYKVVDGAEPALTLDGQQLAYVGRDGQIYVTTVAQGASGQLQITFDAQDPTRLTWTADGRHVAYQTSDGIESIGTSPGAGSNPVTKLAGESGVPSLLVAAKAGVNRVTAPDPIAMSVAVSQARWPSTDRYLAAQGYLGAHEATITTPDEAQSSPNQRWNGPLLLTAGDALDPRTKAELGRIFGDIDPAWGTPRIIIVGTTVSAAVETELRSLGFDVSRVPGAAPAVQDGTGECGPQAGDASLFHQTLIVVDSTNPTDDALATGLADSLSAPIMRTNGDLTAEQRAYLARSSSSIEEVYIVNSSGGVSADVEQAIGDLVSGPAGFTTAENPVMPALV